jgi:hypothetical protein
LPLSAKTEEQRFRVEIDADAADFLTTTPNPLLSLTHPLFAGRRPRLPVPPLASCEQAEGK